MLIQRALVVSGFIAVSGCSPTVGPSQLGKAAVTTDALADGAVTNPKLASAAIDGRVIAAGAVGTIQLASGAVGTGQLADGAVTRAQLADGAVTAAKLDPSAAVLGLNGLTGPVVLAAGDHLSLQATGATITLGLSGPIDAATLGGSTPENFVQLAGSQTFTGAPTFGAPGAPFAVTGTGLVSNLNADLVDGVHANAFSRKVGNVILVGSSGADFTSIQAAIDSITDASPTNRYLVQVGPGTYPGPVVMKSYVDVRGAGPRLTTIALADGPGETVTVMMADDTALLDLNVVNTSSQLPVGVYVPSGSVELRNVTVTATGTSGPNNAIRSTTSGTITLDHVIATGKPNEGYGLLSNSAGPVNAKDSELHGTRAAIYAGPLTFVGCLLDGAIYGNPAKCVGSYKPDLTPLNGTCQ